MRCVPTAPWHRSQGLYGIDLFQGGTLQMDYTGKFLYRHERPAQRLRRRAGTWETPRVAAATTTKAWLDMAPGGDSMIAGRKLVVQMIKSRSKFGPGFVRSWMP